MREARYDRYGKRLESGDLVLVKTMWVGVVSEVLHPVGTKVKTVNVVPLVEGGFLPVSGASENVRVRHVERLDWGPS